MSRQGSRAYYGNNMVEESAFLQENTIETTGAGDTFCGCILHYLAEKGLHGLTERQLREMLVFANGAASLITTRRGALRVMPSKKEIESYIISARDRQPKDGIRTGTSGK